MLRWNASNVMLKTDEADNWKPDKKRSREKIDGIVALVMAAGLAQAAPPPTPVAPSVQFFPIRFNRR